MTLAPGTIFLDVPRVLFYLSLWHCLGDPLLPAVGGLRALAVDVMCANGPNLFRKLLEWVADGRPHRGRLRGLAVLPGVRNVADGAVTLALVLDDVARLAPPILVPLDEMVGVFRDRGLVELLLLDHLDRHDLGDGLG